MQFTITHWGCTPSGDSIYLFRLTNATGALSLIHIYRDEALVGGWIRTTVGEKYILVSNNKQTPYKLFTRDGKFITTIAVSYTHLDVYKRQTQF